MSVYNDLLGSLADSLRIGADGPTIYQGAGSPTISNVSPVLGDLYIEHGDHGATWQYTEQGWKAFAVPEPVSPLNIYHRGNGASVVISNTATSMVMRTIGSKSQRIKVSIDPIEHGITIDADEKEFNLERMGGVLKTTQGGTGLSELELYRLYMGGGRDQAMVPLPLPVPGRFLRASQGGYYWSDPDIPLFVAGDNIRLDKIGNTLVINSVVKGETNHGYNAGVMGGSTADVFREVDVNKNLVFRRLSAGANILFQQTDDTITISTTAQDNDLLSTGNGVPLIQAKSGKFLPIKSVVGGLGIQVTDRGDYVEFSSPAAAQAAKAYNLGLPLANGGDTYAGVNGDRLMFRRLRGGSNIKIQQDSNYVLISADPYPEPGERLSLANLGSADPGSAEVFAYKVDNTVRFRRLQAGRNISITQTPDKIEIAANGLGTVSSVGLVGQNGIEINGGPITTNGYMTVYLNNTGVVAGTYQNPTVTVNPQGRVVAIAEGKQAPTMVTLTAGNIAWNTNESDVFFLNLTTNTIITSIINLNAGSIIRLMVKQDNTGNKTIAWHPDIVWPNQIPVQPSTTANRMTIFSMVCDGTKLYVTDVINY